MGLTLASPPGKPSRTAASSECSTSGRSRKCTRSSPSNEVLSSSYRTANYKFYKEYGFDEYKTFTDAEPSPQLSKPPTLNIWDHNFLDTQTQQLIFSSNFECGNLEKVYSKIGAAFEYYLILSNDTNTLGFNQWFYFRVHNPNYE